MSEAPKKKLTPAEVHAETETHIDGRLEANADYIAETALKFGESWVEAQIGEFGPGRRTPTAVEVGAIAHVWVAAHAAAAGREELVAKAMEEVMRDKLLWMANMTEGYSDE